MPRKLPPLQAVPNKDRAMIERITTLHQFLPMEVVIQGSCNVAYLSKYSHEGSKSPPALGVLPS